MSQVCHHKVFCAPILLQLAHFGWAYNNCIFGMDGKVIGSCKCLINDNLFDFNPRVINLLLVGEKG